MSKEIAKKWFKQAQHDLEMAEKNMGIEGYDVASLRIFVSLAERYNPLEKEDE